MKTILPTLLVFAALGTAAFAGPPATKPAAPAAKPSPAASKKTAEIVCAVTGEKLADAKHSVGTSIYNGKTYYFCCAGCKPKFDKDPAANAKIADARAAAAPAKAPAKKS